MVSASRFPFAAGALPVATGAAARIYHCRQIERFLSRHLTLDSFLRGSTTTAIKTLSTDLFAEFGTISDIAKDAAADVARAEQETADAMIEEFAQRAVSGIIDDALKQVKIDEEKHSECCCSATAAAAATISRCPIIESGGVTAGCRPARSFLRPQSFVFRDVAAVRERHRERV